VSEGPAECLSESDGPFWSETGLILQKLSEVDRATLLQHFRKNNDAARAEATDMGRRLEREAVVRWIAGQPGSTVSDWRPERERAEERLRVACAIGRGEHTRAEEGSDGER
jgi:hypothetical protein